MRRVALRANAAPAMNGVPTFAREAPHEPPAEHRHQRGLEAPVQARPANDGAKNQSVQYVGADAYRARHKSPYNRYRIVRKQRDVVSPFGQRLGEIEGVKSTVNADRDFQDCRT